MLLLSCTSLGADFMRKQFHVLMAISCILVASFSGSNARAQETKAASSSASSQKSLSLQPKATQWNPDEFQRAMKTGTTMPVDAPLPFVDVSPNQTLENLTTVDPPGNFISPTPVETSKPRNQRKP
jgi:hypothetical protein